MQCGENDRMGQCQREPRLFGYQISHRGIHGDIAQAREFIASGRDGHYVACANPHSLVKASYDIIFSHALKQADLLLPDGAGILLAARY